MKMTIPKKWFEESARIEGDSAVGAGSPTVLFASAPVEQDAGAVAAELRVAFGRFVALMRRQRGWSIELLAKKAEVDAAELLRIEEDLRYVPEPMTVHSLAITFKTPEKSLYQLAGLTVFKDATFARAAVRFAAKSESIAKLTAEEQTALECFVAELNSRG
jgi:transcriptional regulator with XRE-family HTH domain